MSPGGSTRAIDHDGSLGVVVRVLPDGDVRQRGTRFAFERSRGWVCRVCLPAGVSLATRDCSLRRIKAELPCGDRVSPGYEISHG